MRRVGFAAAYRWSDVLVPCCWLGTRAHFATHLQPSLLRLGVDERPFLDHVASLEARGVTCENTLIDWLRAHEDAIHERAGPRSGPLGPCLRRLRPFSYLEGYVQEYIVAQGGVGQSLQLAFVHAVHNRRPECSHPTPAAPAPPVCSVCLEALTAPSVAWPGGCGHLFHEECLVLHQAHAFGDAYCPT